MLCFRAWSGTAFLLLFSLAFAQQAPEAPPKFTSQAELVLVPVVVRDKSGAHVTGLKQEDFRLLDEGKQQPIASFEEIRTESGPIQKASRPGEFTNAIAGGHDRRLTIILLDLLNPRWSDQAFAREALLKYLSTSLNAREPVALLVLKRDGLHVVHDFTRDPRVLIAALHKVRGEQQVVDADTGNDPDVDSLAAADESAAIAANIQNLSASVEMAQRMMVGQITRDALRDIANAFAAIPGRKSLIWVSSNLPNLLIDPNSAVGTDPTLLSDLEETWRILNAAAIAVYPVDAAGLTGLKMGSSGFSGAMSGPSTPVTGRGGVRAGGMGGSIPRPSMQQMTIENMKRVAEVTGGRAYVNRNDLDAALREAEQDSSSYYLLAFRPETSDKAKWHKLAVKVHGEHLNVVARNSYLYTPAAQNPANDARFQMQQAASSPLEYTALPLRLRWASTVSNGGTERRVDSEMVVTPEMEAGDNAFNLEVWTIPRMPDGTPQTPMQQVLSGKPQPDVAARIRQGGLVYKNHLQLKPGEYSVRVVVRDNLSGQIGTVTAPLKVE